MDRISSLDSHQCRITASGYPNIALRACGAINGIVTDEDFPRANACMKAHGWMLDGVVHDRPPQGDSPNDPADPMWQTCPFVANC